MRNVKNDLIDVAALLEDQAKWSKIDVTGVTFSDYKAILQERISASSEREKWEDQAKRDDENPYRCINGKTVFVGGEPARQKARECGLTVGKLNNAIMAIEKAHPSYKQQYEKEEQERIEEETRERQKKEAEHEKATTVATFIIAALAWIFLIFFFKKWLLIVFAIGYFCSMCVVQLDKDNPYMDQGLVKQRLTVHFVMLASLIIAIILSFVLQ